MKDGLGDNYCYAVACDRKGRVWAGHLNHGVSVYNGNAEGHWQNYEVVGGLSRPGTLSGPLGERVFHITVDPKDGDVWMATNAGLARYSESKDTWTYYTRAEGLPSDQASSLAFDKDGNLYVATQCDGIAVADAADDYKQWRQILGSGRPPITPSGTGLPTNLLNDILISKGGTIYAATDTGLSWSNDKGETWKFIRGSDWADKVRGHYGGPPKGWKETPGAVLSEDYCTCLAEGLDGKLYVGHRRQGAELLDLKQTTKERLTDAGYVRAITVGDGLQVGTYGQHELFIEPPTHFPVQKSPCTVRSPSTAALLTAEEWKDLDREIAIDLRTKNHTSPAVIALEDDWRTQGDWLGRYGRYWACCCSICAPEDYIWGAGPHQIPYFAQIGPNHYPGDSLRYWVHWLYTANRRSLELPPVYLHSRVVKHLTSWSANRRQAEWDDHAEVYPMTNDGPSIYCTLAVPRGTYCLSLYDMNKDGHSATNELRDYRVSLRQTGESNLTDIRSFNDEVELAHARICDFWGGTYKKFLVRGPVTLTVEVDKRNSLNTILAGVFLDSVEGPTPLVRQKSPAAKMNVDAYVTDTNQNDYEAYARKTRDALATELEEQPLQWAQTSRRLNIQMARRMVAVTTISPKLMELRAPYYHDCSLFNDAEQCQIALGETTAREIEKSLRWDGATRSCSGLESFLLSKRIDAEIRHQ